MCKRVQRPRLLRTSATRHAFRRTHGTMTDGDGYRHSAGVTREQCRAVISAALSTGAKTDAELLERIVDEVSLMALPTTGHSIQAAYCRRRSRTETGRAGRTGSGRTCGSAEPSRASLLHGRQLDRCCSAWAAS